MNSDNIEWKISNSLVKFDYALNFMEKRVDLIAKKEAKSLIWLLEHEPVYTAGISAKDSDLINKTNIPIYQTNRGGKYTYHGPKMIIGYTILDLKNLFLPKSPDIALFVNFLENWIIKFLQEYNIDGFIRKDRVGIWVYENGEEKKIAAIGIKVKKWISYHGLAINIDPDIEAFKNIVPCGIKEFGVTSMSKFIDVNNNNHSFKQTLKNSFYKNLPES